MCNCNFFLLLLWAFLFICNKGSGSDYNYTACNTTSSCGEIRNISYPFRLTTDPPNCGNRSYELTCENGRTLLHLFNGTFLVREINYDSYSIRVVDPGIQKGNCSSLPLYDAISLFDSLDYDDAHYPYDGSMFWERNHILIWVSCDAPVSSPVYVNASVCTTNTVGLEHHYSYVVYWALQASDVADSCTIGTKTFLSFLRWQEVDNTTSYKSIHNAMAFGFYLSWIRIYCDQCAPDTLCQLDATGHVACEARLTTSAFAIDFDTYVPNYIKWVLGLTTSPPFTAERGTIRTSDAVFYLSNSVLLIGAWIIRVYIIIKIACGIPAVFAFLIYTFRRRHMSMHDNVEEFLQNQNGLMPIAYSYSEIKKITKKFKQKLGQGGFGSVYKGTLRSTCDVAVKVLEKSTANGQDFINEIATIGRIHHVNVVRLVGFCVERSRRALVYDFMAKGSLEKYIFAEDGDFRLSWENLYDISLGVARGIEYLHKGCDIQILHFDIKPHNILLDENLTPKISDFGLAKLYPADNSIVTLTAARGTMGYMAPELFYKNLGGVSHKADVYSYGMLLMEMAGRRRNLNAFAEQSSQIYFPLWIYGQLKKGKEREISGVEVEGVEIMKKMAIVGLWCIQLKPSHRPSMSRVIEMLEGSVEELKMPPKPFLTPQETPTEDDESSSMVGISINR